MPDPIYIAGPTASGKSTLALLLSERLGVTVTELAERVRQIDARDGQVDGRHGATQGAPLLHCSACQATIPPGKTNCQFCGAPAPGTKTDPFRI